MRPIPISLIPASEFSAERLAVLINHVYVDYFLPIWLDAEEFITMCRVEDIDLSQSVVALVDEEAAGVALCARRGKRGWVSGVGVLPVHRRQKIANRMLHYLQGRARKLQLETLTLEVLAQNKAGLALYQQLGFKRQRVLLVLTLPELLEPVISAPPKISCLNTQQLLSYYDEWHEIPSAWQRARRTLSQRGSALEGLCYRESGEVVGYLLYQTQSRHQAIYDLAVDPAHDQRIEVGRQLLKAVHRLRPDLGCYLVNLPVDDPLMPAFEQEDYRIWQRQYEMTWQVDL